MTIPGLRVYTCVRHVLEGEIAAGVARFRKVRSLERDADSRQRMAVLIDHAAAIVLMVAAFGASGRSMVIVFVIGFASNPRMSVAFAISV